MTIRFLAAHTIAHTLLSATSLWGQCSMVYNVSVYNDGSVSSDYSMVYAYSTTSDNSTLCGCGHGQYQTTTTVYTPNGTPYSSSSGGMSSNVAVATNGQMGTYTIVGGASLFCSCAGTVGGGGPSKAVTVCPMPASERSEPGSPSWCASCIGGLFMANLEDSGAMIRPQASTLGAQ